MFLHRLTDTELRADCKAAIESLEFWLRRVIDFTLCSHFGRDYVHARDDKTKDYILKKDLREKIKARVAYDPKRYPRDVDAALLGDEIYIVCHRNLYDQFFRQVFASYFPLGGEELRIFLMRIIEPRNALAHSNPLSVRQAEQVICYSHDAIDAIKHHMEEVNMGKEYNAPTIIKITDSRGLEFHDSEISRFGDGLGQVCLVEDRAAWLTVGDTLSIEVEVDPSFPPDDYRIKWDYPKRKAEHAGGRLILNISDRHVRSSFHITCMVLSNKAWHRCGDVDDHVTLMYRVLPANP